MDQVGQGTQHTEALVCREEETECEVSVCGGDGGGGGGKEGPKRVRSEGEEDPRRYSTTSWHLILSPESTHISAAESTCTGQHNRVECGPWLKAAISLLGRAV